jgi:hypothetical protein
MKRHPNSRGAVPDDNDRPGSSSAGIVPVTPDRSPLRQALDRTIANGEAKSMKDLTVLSTNVDPFRLDRPDMHRAGRWLADVASTLALHDRKIHLRGLHYALLGQPKPDGSIYINNEDNWYWLHGDAAKAARWLGYIPFDRIVDQRNAEPVVRIFEPPGEPQPWLSAQVHVEIPDAAEIEPMVGLGSFRGVQPYKVVMVGEKSSLDNVLGPIADRYQADLYLPTGNISDTLIYQMARIGAVDGRPMAVLYFADADPSGWNMAVEVSRKLQAFKILHFPALEFEVHRVALTGPGARVRPAVNTVEGVGVAGRPVARGVRRRTDRDRRPRLAAARTATPARSGCDRAVLRHEP